MNVCLRLDVFRTSCAHDQINFDDSRHKLNLFLGVHKCNRLPYRCIASKLCKILWNSSFHGTPFDCKFWMIFKIWIELLWFVLIFICKFVKLMLNTTMMRIVRIITTKCGFILPLCTLLLIVYCEREWDRPKCEECWNKMMVFSII